MNIAVFLRKNVIHPFLKWATAAQEVDRDVFDMEVLYETNEELENKFKKKVVKVSHGDKFNLDWKLMKIF